MIVAQNVTVRFGKRVAVDDVTLTIRQGDALGIAGDSGSGKTTLARALAAMIDHEGTIERNGSVQLVHQDAGGALNPRMTVGDALAEAPAYHGLPFDVAASLAQVGLRAELESRYPHQLSGGQRQRIVIARALAVKPDTLIADEPVSALDSSVTAQVINLLMELRAQLGLTVVLISHDVEILDHVCSRVIEMQSGRIVAKRPSA